MNGWCGRILRIDLTRGKWESEFPPPEVCRENIGGRGLAGYYLDPDATHQWDDSAMPLLLFTGPLVDTASPTSGRTTSGPCRAEASPSRSRRPFTVNAPFKS